MYHTDTSAMHGPEARAKAIETNRANRTKEAVEKAIELLAESVGYKFTDSAEVINLKAQLAAAVKRAEEAEAKLQLIREATGL